MAWTEVGEVVEVRAALRARFRRTMSWTLLSIPVALFVLLAVLWPQADPVGLIVWCGLGLLSVPVHYVLWYRHPPSVDWTRSARLALAYSGLVWGVAPWLVMPEDQVWSVLLVTAIVAALGASTVFAALLDGGMISFSAPVAILGGLGYLQLAEGDARWGAMAIVGATLFDVVLAYNYRASHLEAITQTIRSHELAVTDELTGASSRREILAVFERWCDEEPQRTGVAFLDIDGFKSVNDEHGHAIGDIVLRDTARRLESVLRDGEMLGRMGGDEFVVISRRMIGRSEAHELAERLLARLDAPFRIADLHLTLGLSIGVAAPSDEVGDPAMLIAEADHAMYCAKRSSDERAISTLGGTRELRPIR